MMEELFLQERKALVLLKQQYLKELQWVNAKMRQIDQMRKENGHRSN